MGVGVYTNDFEGTGTTFMVSPTFYLTSEEHEAYTKAAEDDGADPLSFEDWASGELDDFVIEVKYVLLEALRSLSSNAKMSSPKTDRFTADSAFASVCMNTEFQIGMRQWETDYVVAITPIPATRTLLIEGEEYEGQAVEETGQTLDDLRKNTEAAVEIVKDVVIQTLVRDGYDCRFRTSGYTSSSYEKIADFDFTAKADEYAETFIPTSAPALR